MEFFRIWNYIIVGSWIYRGMDGYPIALDWSAIHRQLVYAHINISTAMFEKIKYAEIIFLENYYKKVVR